MNRRAFGAEGESAARDHLVSKGAKILEMNFRRPTGEIDIIARHKKTLLFVEVKRRSSLRFGRPSEAVDPRKQARILRTAIMYMQENAIDNAPVRFDIIEILPDGVHHIENAFDGTDMI